MQIQSNLQPLLAGHVTILANLFFQSCCCCHKFSGAKVANLFSAVASTFLRFLCPSVFQGDGAIEDELTERAVFIMRQPSVLRLVSFF
jgi:hypothetical protein